LPKQNRNSPKVNEIKDVCEIRTLQEAIFPGAICNGIRISCIVE
jgi:hypothetical protein